MRRCEGGLAPGLAGHGARAGATGPQRRVCAAELRIRVQAFGACHAKGRHNAKGRHHAKGHRHAKDSAMQRDVVMHRDVQVWSVRRGRSRT
eukprot:356123-Chlamydomonas_euryale.AAC.18